VTLTEATSNTLITGSGTASLDIADDDAAGVTVAGSPVAITEGGATGSFTVVLTAQPTADVTISLSPDAQCTLSDTGLTFTQANWARRKP